MLPRLLAVLILGVGGDIIVRHVPFFAGDELARIVVGSLYLLIGVSLLAQARRSALAAIAGGASTQSGMRNLILHLVIIAAYLVVIIFAADMLRFSLAGLAFGGAITGVVLGLAAQSTLGNAFAGLVLLALRPYSPGQWVTLRSWYSSGIEYSGRVRELNLFYTVLDDNMATRVIPNTAALVAYATIAPDSARRGLTAVLPRNIAVSDLKERIEQTAGAQPEITVTAITADSYTVYVVMPYRHGQVWEQVLASYVD